MVPLGRRKHCNRSSQFPLNLLIFSRWSLFPERAQRIQVRVTGRLGPWPRPLSLPLAFPCHLFLGLSSGSSVSWFFTLNPDIHLSSLYLFCLIFAFQPGWAGLSGLRVNLMIIMTSSQSWLEHSRVSEKGEVLKMFREGS